jgi:hypothetical protein
MIAERADECPGDVVLVRMHAVEMVRLRVALRCPEKLSP